MRNTGLQSAPNRLPLDLGGPYPGQGVPIPEMEMFGAAPTPYFDGRADATIRTTRVVDQMRAYPLQEENRELLYELSNVVGHEGGDSQNPYVWASRGVLQLAGQQAGIGSGLVNTGYGIRMADTIDNVAMNAQATAGIMEV